MAIAHELSNSVYNESIQQCIARIRAQQFPKCDEEAVQLLMNLPISDPATLEWLRALQDVEIESNDIEVEIPQDPFISGCDYVFVAPTAVAVFQNALISLKQPCVTYNIVEYWIEYPCGANASFFSHNFPIWFCPKIHGIHYLHFKVILENRTFILSIEMLCECHAYQLTSALDALDDIHHSAWGLGGSDGLTPMGTGSCQWTTGLEESCIDLLVALDDMWESSMSNTLTSFGMASRASGLEKLLKNDFDKLIERFGLLLESHDSSNMYISFNLLSQYIIQYKLFPNILDCKLLIIKFNNFCIERWKCISINVKYILYNRLKKINIYR
eukprot:GHVL01027721.1.p1 GENE.GHVL01027721.1~~GHVL01027721.1.p1  ORF type:complete len:328 (+),score=61.95 GHVL01027721.1:48-1031(+)